MPFTGEVYTGRTGGAATDLDVKDGNNITVNDFAFVLDSGISYIYKAFDDGSTEHDPKVIVPDTNPGTKCWKLQSAYSLNDYTVEALGYFSSIM